MWQDIVEQRLEDIDAEIAELRRQKELLIRLLIGAKNAE